MMFAMAWSIESGMRAQTFTPASTRDKYPNDRWRPEAARVRRFFGGGCYSNRRCVRLKFVRHAVLRGATRETASELHQTTSMKLACGFARLFVSLTLTPRPFLLLLRPHVVFHVLDVAAEAFELVGHVA